MKLKPSCCRKYEKKAKACKSCPLLAAIGKKELRRMLKKGKKRALRKRAA